MALALLLVDLRHGENPVCRPADGLFGLAHGGFIGEGELFDLLPGVTGQASLNGLRFPGRLPGGGFSRDRPVFPRLEGGDFVFPLHDQAQCRALHPSR